MESWLVSSNCQTFGLANSIGLLCEDVETEGVDYWAFRNDVSRYCEEFGRYSKIVVGPEVRALIPDEYVARHDVVVVPTVTFAAYHPDLTYIAREAEGFKGAMDAYHSIIAFAGHLSGLTVDQTLTFYNARAYRQFGYLDRWTRERDALIEHFQAHGLDIALAVRRWGRGRAFMYSIDHPAVHVVHDIARIFLESLGKTITSPTMLPHDNLLTGPCFPVYTEIGEALGVPGSYRFKPMARYRDMGLREFVEQSFAAYEGEQPGALFLSHREQPVLDHICSIMRGGRS